MHIYMEIMGGWKLKVDWRRGGELRYMGTAGYALWSAQVRGGLGKTSRYFSSPVLMVEDGLKTARSGARSMGNDMEHRSPNDGVGSSDLAVWRACRTR